MTVADPLQSTLPPGRHGLPKEFIAENQRTRLVSGFLQAVRERGYCATTIADICRRASISRRTFYEHFDGKTAIGNAVMTDAIDTAVPLNAGLGIYVVEMLCRAADEPDGARKSIELMRSALARFRDLEEDPPPERSPALRRTPAGPRPRLSSDFLAESQRQRIVTATAKCILDRRYVEVRVGDIVSAACIARNTFYERFPNKEAAAKAVIAAGSSELAEWFNGIPVDTGFAIVAIELAAAFHAEGREELLRQADAVARALDMVQDAMEAS